MTKTAYLEPFKVRLLLATAVALALPSCSAPDGSEQPVVPVSGTVMVQEQPAENALVVFHPLHSDANSPLRPSGHVGPDGKFTLGSYRAGDGAPIGQYAVTIVWPEQPSGPMPDPDLAPDRLRGRYANPANSPLRVQVNAGGAQLAPFELK